MTFSIDIDSVSVRYRDVTAINDLSLTVPGGTICGVLGRNGAGKTTLLSTIAGYRSPDRGTVLVDGEAPYENPRVVSDVCLVREGGDCHSATTVKDVIGIAGTLRPRWDGDFAERLMDRFEIPKKTKVGALSRGKRAALAVTIGLAARAPLTMFDEPHLGMDVPSRYAFYDELLADYVEHPRTILFSTHLIDEVASLLESVAIVDHGTLLTHRAVDDLQAQGAEITGPLEAVDILAGTFRVLSERSLGQTKSIVVLEPIEEVKRAYAASNHVDIGPIALQDLFVHLTNEEGPR